jgi:hypothetical protein
MSIDIKFREALYTTYTSIFDVDDEKKINILIQDKPKVVLSMINNKIEDLLEEFPEDIGIDRSIFELDLLRNKINFYSTVVKIIIKNLKKVQAYWVILYPMSKFSVVNLNQKIELVDKLKEVRINKIEQIIAYQEGLKILENEIHKDVVKYCVKCYL